MVEPLFRVETQQLPAVGELVALTGAEAKHAISVRRMRVGEAIQLSNGHGLRVRGVVRSITGNELIVQVGEATQEARPAIELHLAQALAKGDRDELAIQAATELGVMSVIPWQADRSVSRWDAAKAVKGVERWQTICTEAAKQALRVWHPGVQLPVTSKQLATRLGDFDLVLVLEPTGTSSLASVLASAPAKLALVVGPEGGIDDSELALLEAAGAKLVHLGQEVLRTSTAGMAAIAATNALLGNWSRG